MLACLAFVNRVAFAMGSCEVELEVRFSETLWGESLAVVGDHPSLSLWGETKAPIPLSSDAFPYWRATLTLPACTRMEYKYVIMSGGRIVRWETLSGNRTMITPVAGQIVRVCDRGLGHRARLSSTDIASSGDLNEERKKNGKRDLSQDGKSPNVHTQRYKHIRTELERSRTYTARMLSLLGSRVNESAQETNTSSLEDSLDCALKNAHAVRERLQMLDNKEADEADEVKDKNSAKNDDKYVETSTTDSHVQDSSACAIAVALAVTALVLTAGTAWRLCTIGDVCRRLFVM